MIAPAPVVLHPSSGMSLGHSAGCGTKPLQKSGIFETHNIATTRRERIYALRLPDHYDPQRAYPLLLRFHGSGGTGLSGGLGIERIAGGDVIIVAPNGLDQSWGPATRDDDLALFDALIGHLSAHLCVDLDRIFAYGFSAGAGFANTLACKRGLLVRAVAAIAGSPPEGKCEGTAAQWLMHDVGDDSVPIAEGRAARERARISNRCSRDTEVRADGCEYHLGCRSGDPVVWCETHGIGHNVRGKDAPQRVWAFFSGLSP